MRQLFRELKRRNVYKVAVTYAAVAFVTLQAARLIFPATTLEGAYDVLVLVAFVGFPIALVIAWAFELTPEGVRRTSDAEGPESGEAAAEQPRPGSRLALKALVGLGLVGAAVAGGWYLMGGGGENPEISEQTVAVLPFQVSGSGADSWRDGMVTMLSTGLDGAGGLRAIADQTVLAAWERAGQRGGSSTGSRSLTTARQVGAEYAILGQAVQLGEELRLAADIHDTKSGERVGQVEVAGSPDHVTALTDSLTRRILGVLLEKSDHGLPSVNLASLTTSSLPALKSYLRGERHYRDGEYEAAIEDYETAVEHDSSFALAYARLNIARSWGGVPGGGQNLHRAYEFSDRLPLRERRIVRARHIHVQGHSLAAADSFRRLSEEYPDDPSVWYWLGETVFHGWIPGGWPEAETAFEEAVKLDPGIASYHHHRVGLALSLHHDSALAAHRLEAHPEGPEKTWLQILWDLNFGSTERREDAWTRMDTIELRHAVWAYFPLSHPTDKALQERVLEALVERGAERADFYLALTRLQDGRIDEALTPYPNLPERASALLDCALAESLTLGYPLPDSIVRSRLDPLRISDDGYLPVLRLGCAGLSLIAQDRGDELGPVLKRLHSIPERLDDPPDGIQSRVDQFVRSLEGYRAWSAGDLQTAAKFWSGSSQFRSAGAILQGDLHRDLGQLETAEDWYVAGWPHPVAHERLGQLYEEMGRPEDAAAAYRRFVAAWEDADPELQDRVVRARERLQALTGQQDASNE